MPTHASLGAAIESAAATAPDVWSKIKAGIAALEAYVLAGGRSFIDTPQERSDLEAQAVKAFNAVFNLSGGDLATELVDGFVKSAIDRLLVYLSATPTIPAVTVDPPAPQPPVGSAPQGSAP